MNTKSSANLGVVTLPVDAFLGQVLRAEVKGATTNLRYVAEAGKVPPSLAVLQASEVTEFELSAIGDVLLAYGPVEVTARPAVLRFLLASAAIQASTRAQSATSDRHPLGESGKIVTACGEGLSRLADITDEHPRVTSATLTLSADLARAVRDDLAAWRDDCDTDYLRFADVWDELLAQLDADTDNVTVIAPASVLRCSLAWQASRENVPPEADADGDEFDAERAGEWFALAGEAIAAVKLIDAATGPRGSRA